jgi:hypothetical protein
MRKAQSTFKADFSATFLRASRLTSAACRLQLAFVGNRINLVKPRGNDKAKTRSPKNPTVHKPTMASSFAFFSTQRRVSQGVSQQFRPRKSASQFLFKLSFSSSIKRSS